MALETDKATEARRKALRNGEEDPVVVAQRFLNIYRQMHILSPERKESFNKMLLELSPDIRGIFSSLPGGAMLQDYADELAEKSGVPRSAHTAADIHLDEGAHQQAQILATALAQAQNQAAAAAPAPATIAGSAKISLDKDFAGEFAKILGALIQQQTTVQKESLEKLTSDLSKTQLFIAKNMKENKEEQREELKELCRTLEAGNQQSRDDRQKEFGDLCRILMSGLKEGREEQTRSLGEICKTVSESYQNARADQTRDIGELCKAIMQSQTALSSSLSSLSREIPAAAPVQAVTATAATIDEGTRKLIEVVLDGQKQLNMRLDKFEASATEKANDNKELLTVFEKTQTEIIKNLSQIQIQTPVVRQEDNTEKLVRLINESQDKLVKTLLSANIQQNNTAQSNNNANNIQITAPDNSAALIMLTDKIASLQAANEHNLEKAISKTIEEQGRLYDKISRRQTKELAEILAESLKGIQPVYLNGPAFNPTVPEPQIPEDINSGLAPISAVGQDNGYATEQNAVYDIEPFPPTDEEDTVYPNEDMPDRNIENISENENIPLKKKKKKKQKKKNIAGADDSPFISENNAVTEDVLPETVPLQEETPPYENDITDIPLPAEISFEDLPSDDVDTDIAEDLPEPGNEEIIPPSENNEAAVLVDTAVPEEKQVIDTVSDDKILENPVAEERSSDWGFVDSPSAEDTAITETAVNIGDSDSNDWGFGSSVADNSTEDSSAEYNDNEEGQNWEWVYVDENDENIEPGMEAIGDNSYICTGNLYDQEKDTADNPILYASVPVSLSIPPVIIDNTADNDEIDPYQNSILKD